MTTKIFLDTSVLPRGTAHFSAEFSALQQLAREGLVEVSISKIAYDEWVTQRRNEFLDKLRQCRTSLKSLVRDPRIGKLGIHDQIVEFNSLIEENGTEFENVAVESAKAVLGSIRPAVLPVTGGHASSAFERYFVGEQPYRSVKSREDIPDAFIFESLRDVAASGQDLVHAAISDGRLRRAADTLVNVRVYKSLAELLEGPELAKAVARLEKAEAWQSWLKQYCSKVPERWPVIETEIKEADLNFLAYQTVRHPQIPADNHEGTLSMFDEPFDTLFDWNGLRESGVGILSVPVSFDLDVFIDFYVFRMDAYCVPDKVSVLFGDPDEDVFFEGEANVRVRVHTEVTLRISEKDIDSETFGDLEEVSIVEPCELEVIEDEKGEIFR